MRFLPTFCVFAAMSSAGAHANNGFVIFAPDGKAADGLYAQMTPAELSQVQYRFGVPVQRILEIHVRVAGSGAEAQNCRALIKKTVSENTFLSQSSRDVKDLRPSYIQISGPMTITSPYDYFAGASTVSVEDSPRLKCSSVSWKSLVDQQAIVGSYLAFKQKSDAECVQNSQQWGDGVCALTTTDSVEASLGFGARVYPQSSRVFLQTDNPAHASCINKAKEAAQSGKTLEISGGLVFDSKLGGNRVLVASQGFKCGIRSN